MKCPYCNRKPKDIPEYVEAAKYENISPEDYVKLEEGTFHHLTQLFCCTDCYVRIGLPLNQDLFKAFNYYRSNVEPLEVSK